MRKFDNFFCTYSDKGLVRGTTGGTTNTTLGVTPQLVLPVTFGVMTFRHCWCYSHRPRLATKSISTGDLERGCIKPPPVVNMPRFCCKVQECCAITTESKPVYSAPPESVSSSRETNVTLAPIRESTRLAETRRVCRLADPIPTRCW